MGSPVTSRTISMPCGVCGADASAGSSARMIARLSLNGYTSISNRRPLDAEAVFRLVDRMQRRVRLHEILDVFLLRDRLFRLPRARVRVALLGVEIQIFLPVFLLADAADDVRLRPER